MEHLKCRLQVQHGKGSPDTFYKGPVHVARSIFSGYGVTGMSWARQIAFRVNE
jgi:hypothetical protein